MGAVALAPETLRQRASMRAYRPLRVRVEADTAGHLGAAAAGFASFAVFALFTSLAPEFVGGTLHHASRALAGVIVFAVFGAAAAAQTLTSPLDALVRRSIGLLAQAAGVVVLAVGMQTASLALFLIGGIVASMGAGVLFKSAVGAVAAMAGPATRGRSPGRPVPHLLRRHGRAGRGHRRGHALHQRNRGGDRVHRVLLVLLATVGALTVRSTRGDDAAA